jgi:hypothetical protein
MIFENMFLFKETNIVVYKNIRLKFLRRNSNASY